MLEAKAADGLLSEICLFPKASTNNIRRRIAIVGSVLIAAPVLILSLAGWALTQRVQQPSPIDRARPSKETLTQLTQNLVDLCRQYQQETVLKLKSGQIILAATGPIRLNAKSTQIWQAKNEVTGQFESVAMPFMTAGESHIAPVVDEIARVTGIAATIFERMNDRGDMLRICSSVKSETGGRAIGSFVPAGAHDTDEVKALQDVLNGKTYLGKELEGNITYLTAYQPLKTISGNIVGMLYTSVPEDQISTQLRTQVKPLPDGPAPFIFKASGETRGTVLVGDRLLAGSNLQELCSQALRLAAGEFADCKYQKTPKPGGLPKAMTARFAYVPELQWVVGFAQPDSEIVAVALAPSALWFLFGIGVAGTALSVSIWLKVSNALTQNTGEILTKAAKTIHEITAALQHIDASRDSVVGLIEVIDQITFATNLLMVNAAIQSSSTSDSSESLVSVADDLRSLADRCRKAARTTKDEIEQSRADLHRLTHGLAQSLDPTAEVITTDLSHSDH